LFEVWGVEVGCGGGDSVSADLMGGTSTCWIPLRAWSEALIRAAAAAAAAAASVGDFFVSGIASFVTGLRSLPDSERRDGGERERRSNREVLLGSGSVWSKRERFTVRRSDSSMARCKN
jgi:hypothetical protein